VRATAQGSRKEQSKLRGHIEPFSLAHVSLVRGKEHWRATSAEFIQSISSVAIVARPLALLEKLVQGESPHPELFDAVEQAINYLAVSPPSDEIFEIRLVSQILYHLGYLKKEDLNLDKKDLINAINEGIQVSHL
jgi:recombinational DNA repair protein (RecF pathway)